MEYNVKPVDSKKNKHILGKMESHVVSLHIKISCKGWALTFLMRGFGLSKNYQSRLGFPFLTKG